jgi:hypothetical protein
MVGHYSPTSPKRLNYQQSYLDIFADKPIRINPKYINMKHLALDKSTRDAPKIEWKTTYSKFPIHISKD